MARIEEIKSGSLAKSKKLNEVIRYLNSLLNAKVREGSSNESPKLVAGEISTEIITTGGSGGGVPEGFAEETLDVVNSDNTAGQRVFLTKAV